MSTINLPKLQSYRASIAENGLTIPLRTIPIEKKGLLNVLPALDQEKSGWPWTVQTDPETYKNRDLWPKITIVTPSYNQGAFIEQTIRSVLLQNYPNLEYIVMDGGSTDNTKDLLSKYSTWISYWECTKDRGQGHAINKGFSISSGSYLAWINSDDFYSIDTFKLVADTFLTIDTDFVYGYGVNHYVQDNRDELIKVEKFIDRFIRVSRLFQPSCFWSSSIHQPIWEELQCSLDYELWLRMVNGKRKKLITVPLSTANVHDLAKTSNPSMDIAWRNDHLLICSENAHGAVNNWDYLIFSQRLWRKLNQLWPF